MSCRRVPPSARRDPRSLRAAAGPAPALSAAGRGGQREARTGEWPQWGPARWQLRARVDTSEGTRREPLPVSSPGSRGPRG